MASLEKMAKTLLSGVSENNLLVKSLLTETLRHQEILIEQNRALLAKTSEICALLDALRSPERTPSE
ncbi:MAG: hypothetical protein J6B02_04575 [Selenomonadales bacterium]|nr:hypothetical protein [Selenomonadales bacterium]